VSDTTISFRISPASARRAERRSRIVIEVRLRWAQPYPRTGRVLYAPAIVGAIRAVMQCAARYCPARSRVREYMPLQGRIARGAGGEPTHVGGLQVQNRYSPAVRGCKLLILKADLAERVGFEPTCPCGQDAFEAPPLRPLRYLSVITSLGGGPFNIPHLAARSRPASRPSLRRSLAAAGAFLLRSRSASPTPLRRSLCAARSVPFAAGRRGGAAQIPTSDCRFEGFPPALARA
jgi:hypothetical protein